MRKIIFLLSLVFLAGCFESAPTTTVSVAGSYHLWEEKEFSISVPEGYERVMPGQADLTLPQDFVAGYSEVRLDEKFATTITIHRESLQANITSQTYALVLRDASANATDYREIDFKDNNGTYLHKFETKLSTSEDKIIVTQSAFSHNSKGWVVSCATADATTDICDKTVSSFVLKQ